MDFLKENHFPKEIATMAMGVKEPCYPKVGNVEE
jgi:hypothetical protein